VFLFLCKYILIFEIYEKSKKHLWKMEHVLKICNFLISQKKQKMKG